MTGAGYLQPHVALVVGDDPDVRSGAGDRLQDLPDRVSFMSKSWGGFDALVQAGKAVCQPQLPVT